MSRVSRHAALIGVIAGALRVPVGWLTTAFYTPYLAKLAGLDGKAIISWLFFALASAHALPLVLFAGALRGRADTLRFWVMLICALVVAWPGVDAVLRGDWGDLVLWGLYLLTGTCLLLCGASGLLAGKR